MCIRDRVYVGIGGQSLRTIRNTEVRHLEEETKISQELIDSITVSYTHLVIGRVPWKQLAKLMGTVGVVVILFVGIVMVMPTHKLNKVPMMHQMCIRDRQRRSDMQSALPKRQVENCRKEITRWKKN